MMDDDLEKVLNDLWKVDPHLTVEYAQIKSRLLLVQELRNLQKTVKEVLQ
jgi:hypothetical protein